MDIEHLKKQIEDEDFVIRIRPFADDDDYGQLMHFSKMMCASVPVMEEVPELRNVVHEYVLNVIDNEMDITVELEEEMGVEKTYDGNVIHLNFNTKTGGSA